MRSALPADGADRGAATYPGPLIVSRTRVLLLPDAGDQVVGHRPWASTLFRPPKRRNPTFWGWGFCPAGEPDDYLLSHGQSALSSAWSRFTVLFGMGRGGTDSLWSSGMTCCRVALAGATTNLEEVVSDESTSADAGCVVRGTTLITQPRVRVLSEPRHTCYRIKPYGQLVSVSLTHYCASTPDLSTSWS